MICSNFLLIKRLYRSGHPKKIEKLKCILHYFRRITERSKCSIISCLMLFEHLSILVPNGVITIRRLALSVDILPSWAKSKTELCDLHLTTDKKIEDINNVLQVNI